MLKRLLGGIGRNVRTYKYKILNAENDNESLDGCANNERSNWKFQYHESVLVLIPTSLDFFLVVKNIFPSRFQTNGLIT